MVYCGRMHNAICLPVLCANGSSKASCNAIQRSCWIIVNGGDDAYLRWSQMYVLLDDMGQL